ncbi:MAG: nicotinate-nucleotide adenylyltransferase [Rhodobacteraceae bacterium]|nr:nicotinate-nucleotide adenylyltransferase [Paracoccaceae bacterium]
MRSGFPKAAPGQSVGVLGGSFDPPHAGHVHITRTALKRFGLDRVWWLVSPGNPLKARAPAPLAKRIAAGRALMTHPRVEVCGIEEQLGTRYTAETLSALQAHYPEVRFVWLMGADNLADFHRWERWREIMYRVPVGVLARPGTGIAARTSLAARLFQAARLPGRASQLLARADAPAWCYVNLPLSDVSSTAIRAQGDWNATSAGKKREKGVARKPG